jgi:hypothetical protein
MPKERRDPFRDILGLELDKDRLEANLDAFAPILDEIRKLRELDLSETPPAVVFDPARGYGGREE